VSVNEINTLPLLPFGDQADPLVKAAMARISGKVAKTSISLNTMLSGAFQPGNILMDSRAQSAQQGMVITHR
jgi:hypothetical protein